jgi:hypothetical protein
VQINLPGLISVLWKLPLQPRAHCDVGTSNCSQPDSELCLKLMSEPPIPNFKPLLHNQRNFLRPKLLFSFP